jgi:putative phage-type endonuclease
MTLHLVQGSQEWITARLGSLGASQVHEAVTKLKSGGYVAQRANVCANVLLERLNGTAVDCYVSEAMDWGTKCEPDARAAYEFWADVAVDLVGLVPHPTIKSTHASPDGLVGEDGLVEIKCPNSATHLETLLTKKVPAKYITQMQWQLCCTGRKWCDYVSFDPRFPPEHRTFITRIERDDEKIKELESEVVLFLQEVEDKLAQLSNGKDEVRAAA